jgi:hypothetical protein
VSLWKCRTVENVENQRRVSHLSHRAWKSHKARFPHSHRQRIAMGIRNESQNPGSRPWGRKPKPLPFTALVGYKKI